VEAASSSSAAAATPGTGLGFGEAAQLALSALFPDEGVDPTAISVRFTLLGDANLDQHVDFQRSGRVAQNYGASGKTWPDGDFTGEGDVAFGDLVLLAQNYGVLLPSPAPAATAAADPIPAQSASLPPACPARRQKPKPAPILRPKHSNPRPRRSGPGPQTSSRSGRLSLLWCGRPRLLLILISKQARRPAPQKSTWRS